MLRPAIRIPVLRGTFLVPKASRFTTPIVMHPRIAGWTAFSRKMGESRTDPGVVSPSPSGPSQHKSKPQNESPGGRNHRYDHWNSFWDPNAGPCSKSPAFQDVRCRGPLFNLSKIELDNDPEEAKQQWRRLCVELQLKQGIASMLWNEKEVLNIRLKCAEATCESLRESLDSFTETCVELEAENVRLREEIHRLSRPRYLLRRNMTRTASRFDELGNEATISGRRTGGGERNGSLSTFITLIGLGFIPVALWDIAFSHTSLS